MFRFIFSPAKYTSPLMLQFYIYIRQIIALQSNHCIAVRPQHYSPTIVLQYAKLLALFRNKKGKEKEDL